MNQWVIELRNHPNKELRKIIKTLTDENWNMIPEKFTWNYFNQHPEIKTILDKFNPDIYDSLTAIVAYQDLKSAKKKYAKRKPYYIAFFSLIWLAIYQIWWAVIWFIVGYIIRNYFEPEKVLDRIKQKNEDINS